jgi:signal transduction histidine kinase
MIMDSRKIKTLIVDDDSFVRDMLGMILQSSDYEVATAENGADALEKFKADAGIDLIISDMNMPGMNGLELIKAIRDGGSDVPIIILTGNNEISIAIEAIRSGANDYLLKDENIQDTIILSVERVMEKHHLKLQNIRLMADLAEKNKELEKSNAELKELNNLKNKFLGIAAHDLRNPLTAISGLSEILIGGAFGPLTPEQQEYLSIINGTSNEMLGLVNDLLDVSIIESGNLDLVLKKDSLKGIVENRIKINSVIAQRKNITIHAALHDVPDTLFDPNRIAQVMDNLIGNAIKFSPIGSCVYITLENKGDALQVSVKDEGPGIPEDEKAKLFGEFQRLSVQPTGGEKSTGLGLAIVKKIVNAHGGDVRVESAVGSGTTFYFTIPTDGGT